MARMPPAPLAVLAQGDAVRVVALGLVGLVVPALALLAGEGDGDPDVSAGHNGVLRESRGLRYWRRAEKNPATARGRLLRIARGRAGSATGGPAPRSVAWSGAEAGPDGRRRGTRR